MRDTFFLSKKFIQKKEFKQALKTIAERIDLKIDEENVNDGKDLDLYSEDEIFTFFIGDEESFSNSSYEIDNQLYYVYAIVSHLSDSMPKVNQIIRLLFETYSRLKVCDCRFIEFFGAQDFNSGNLSYRFKLK